MTKQQFRILHSTLIEHYQFIEAQLEGIYALLSGKEFSEGLEDVEKHNLARLISDLKAVQLKSGRKILTDNDLDRISELCRERNFWVHNCYYDLAFNSKDTGIKHERDSVRLKTAITTAEEMRDELFAKKKQLLEESVKRQ